MGRAFHKINSTSNMLKQILSILLIALLAQTSAIIYSRETFINTINDMATRVPDFANTFNIAFNNIFGPSGTIPLQDLNNIRDSMVQAKFSNIASIKRNLDDVINLVLTNMKTSMNNLATSISSNMAIILSQENKSSQLAKLFIDTINSDQVRKPMVTMIDALNNETQAVVTTVIKTLTVDIEGLKQITLMVLSGVTANHEAASTLLQTVTEKLSDPSITSYMQNVKQSIQNTITTFFWRALIIYSNANQKINDTLTKIDTNIEVLLQTMGFNFVDVSNKVAANLASSNLKARQCSTKIYSILPMMEETILSTSACLKSVTPVIQNLLSTMSSTYGKIGQANIDQFTIAITCLSQPASTRLSCFQPIIEKIISSTSSMEQAKNDWANIVSTSLGNVESEISSCSNKVMANFSVLFYKFQDDYTYCMNH